MRYYPVFLRLAGKRVLLFGAGKVALRKARALSKAGAKLDVIARETSEPFAKFARARQIKIEQGSGIPRSLRSYALVIAATSDPAFNRLAARKCGKERIWVNVVTDRDASTFIVPSVVRRKGFQIAISTGGRNPRLAKSLRKQLSQQLRVNALAAKGEVR